MIEELVTYELWYTPASTGKENRIASGLGSYDSADGYRNDFVIGDGEVKIVEVKEVRSVVG